LTTKWGSEHTNHARSYGELQRFESEKGGKTNDSIDFDRVVDNVMQMTFAQGRNEVTNKVRSQWLSRQSVTAEPNRKE
jgi:hypothetical protein